MFACLLDILNRSFFSVSFHLAALVSNIFTMGTFMTVFPDILNALMRHSLNTHGMIYVMKYSSTLYISSLDLCTFGVLKPAVSGETSKL